MYCNLCGQKMVEEWNGRYKPDTGEKEMRMVCKNNDPCAHGNHKYKSSYDGIKGFLNSRGTITCILCDKKWHDQFLGE